jgi:hypothetical protein
MNQHLWFYRSNMMVYISNIAVEHSKMGNLNNPKGVTHTYIYNYIYIYDYIYIHIYIYFEPIVQGHSPCSCASKGWSDASSSGD